jgi:hypothetical protein
MIRLTPLRFRALPIALALVAGAPCWSTTSFAQSAPAPDAAPAATTAQPARPSTGDTVRLTDEQRDAILNNNTVESAAAASGELTDSEIAKPRIHANSAS